MRTCRALPAFVASGMLALVVLGCGESSQPGATTGGSAAASGAVVRVAALDRPARGEHDAIPEEIANQEIMRGQLDLATAHLVRAGEGEPVWLARSADGRSVCVVAAGTLNCTYAQELADSGFAPALSWQLNEPVHVSGIASDAVDHVEVTLRNGAVERVEVMDNVLSLELFALPRAISWVGPDGRKKLDYSNLRRKTRLPASARAARR